LHYSVSASVIEFALCQSTSSSFYNSTSMIGILQEQLVLGKIMN